MPTLVFRVLVLALAAAGLSAAITPSGPDAMAAHAPAYLLAQREAPCLPPALTAANELRPQSDGTRSFVPGMVVVKVRPGLTEQQAASLAQSVGGTVSCRFDGWDIYLVQVAPGAEPEAVAALQGHPWVATAQGEHAVRLLGTPNDTSFAQQWALAKINAAAAWDISTGSNVIIAIVDSGIDLTHPDLQNQVVSPYNVIDNSPNATDDIGHGTHVAGIAAAEANNGAGIAGVAWGARIMPVKAISLTSTDEETFIAKGIRYAVDRGAKVINISLGAPTPEVVLEQAVNYAHSKGALVIAAAGNCFSDGAECDGKINPPIYPAAYENVLAVGGTGPQDEHGPYSETGDYVDLVAPGGNLGADTGQGILSTALRSQEASGYRVFSGTSQAAPHVSGVAALIWSVNPALTNDQVARILVSTATDLGAAGKDPIFGAGRVDALKAVQMARALAQPPALGGPASGSTLTTMSTSLTWTNPPGTTQYQIQVTPANNDGPAVNLIRNAEQAFTLQAPVLGAGPYFLLPGMTYTWRVRATAKATSISENDLLWGPWSSARTFRTPAPSSAGLSPVSPAAGATVANINAQALRWQHTNNALFYWEVQVSGDTRFDPNPATATSFVWWNLVHGGVTNPVNSWTTPPLEAKTTYFWRVRPRVQGDGTAVDWGPTWSFTVSSAAPGPTATPPSAATPVPTPSPTPTPRTPTPTPTSAPSSDDMPAPPSSDYYFAFLASQGGNTVISVAPSDDGGLSSLSENLADGTGSAGPSRQD